MEIASRQNAKFKAWLDLLEGRGIKKSGHALIAGRKIVPEFIEQQPDAIVDVLLPPRAQFSATKPTYKLAAPLFQELDVMGTRFPLLVVKTPSLKIWEPGTPKGLELIVALSDPGNLGTLIRSAEAFAVEKVILTKEAASPFLPKVTRAASGANFRIKLSTTASQLADINIKSGFALDMAGENIGQLDWPKHLYLVLGEEGRGLPDSLKLKSLSIPMNGKSESLNATTAASIALFSYRLKHGTPVA